MTARPTHKPGKSRLRHSSSPASEDEESTRVKTRLSPRYLYQDLYFIANYPVHNLNVRPDVLRPGQRGFRS